MKGKDSLGIGLWGGQVTDGGEREGRPVERTEVLARERGVFPGSVRVHPVPLELLRLGQQEVEAAEPVSKYQQDVDQVQHSPQVRVDCA